MNNDHLISLPIWIESSATAKLVHELQPKNTQWMSLRFVHRESESLFTRDGIPDHEGFSTTSGAMIEVLVNGYFGYTATTNLTVSGLKAAAQEAALIASRHSIYGLNRFTQEETRIASKGIYSSPAHDTRSLSEINAEAFQTLVGLHKYLKAGDKITRTVAGFVLTRTHSRFVSTAGADVIQRFSQATPHLSATARDTSNVQTRTNFGHSAQSRQAGLESFFGGQTPSFTLANLAKSIGHEALELLNAPDCPTEKTTLLIMPDQMMLQIHESIGHPLELDRILGDERNYAGSSFVSVEDFGKLKYGSPLLNVTFDPTVDDEFASYAFDDTGAPSSREFLIRNGILERGLGGQESQLRTRLKGTANMRASSWNRPPIDRMANINLEPGQGSLTDLIAGVERGVLMQSNKSWSIDDYRNKFQFGCEYAREIRDGKLGKVLKNPNYRAVTLSFWNSLTAVGGPETLGTFGTPYCGKGEPNQAISVGHRSPACVFRDIEVFGGES